MLKVLKPGFYTTLQDQGRYHYRHFGVPVSGALDQTALRRVNGLLENDPDAAVLECTMQGPELVFEEPTFIALGGGTMEAELQGEAVEGNRVYQVAAGQVLRCGHVTRGLRVYLAVRGGFQSEQRLGSRSQFYPVTPAPRLDKGMQIPYAPCTEFEPKLLKVSSPSYFEKEDLVVFPGPDYGILSEGQRTQILEGSFQLSKAHDRMACQLEPAISGHSFDMITSATLPGTVQLTPAGTLIILMRDGQTTGGYPRILQLDMASLDLMGQKRFGDKVRFREA